MMADFHAPSHLAAFGPTTTRFTSSWDVRQVFGLQPKDVIAGCRRLALHLEPGRRSAR